MVAGVLIKTEPQKERRVFEALKKMEGLSYVYMLFGRYDMVALVRALDLEHGSLVAGRQAHDRLDGDRAVGAGLPQADPQVLAQVLGEPLRPAQGAGKVRANLDPVAATRLVVEEGVEPDQRPDLGGGQLEQVSHLGDGLLGDMAILALGQEQQGHDCRTAAPLRVLGQDGFDLGRVFLLQHHGRNVQRSISPRIGSRLLRMATTSATRWPLASIGSACTLAKLGVRKWTR